MKGRQILESILSDKLQTIFWNIPKSKGWKFDWDTPSVHLTTLRLSREGTQDI